MSEAASRLGDALADRYRLERELGQGGMATVYLAEDVRHHRKVAVKVLRPELAAVLGGERFLREIETTAGLRHPHILPLYDSGEAAGFLLYVMPYVEGESLRDRLDRQKQLPLEEVLHITAEVADALGYAHARGIVHRDIKPENILLEGGHAVVADFGIAKAVSAVGGDRLTQTGMAVGTPLYMSPEQAAGEKDLDGRADEYSLACTVYEMLAGQPPFTGPTAESVVHQHLAVEPRAVSEIRPAVPAAMAAALQRALAKNPADRYGTVPQLSDALRQGGPTSSGAAATPPRGKAISRRLGAIVAAAAAVVLAAAGGIWWVAARSEGPPLDDTLIAVMPFRVGGDPAVAYLRESMLDLIDARLAGGAGARAVPPRTVLSAWRRAVSTEQDDLSEADARRLAARLGAGRLLLGSVVTTPSDVTLRGSLIDVADGAVLADAAVSGAPDSVAQLVNRVTARLLSLGAGEGRDRVAGLAAVPLAALQDYLAGRRAYRRGDYFAAMDLYGRALAQDSSFVEAAFGLVTTNPLIGTVSSVAGWEVIPRVWRLRERLSPGDRGLFLGMPFVGPNYPRPSTIREIVAQAERAARETPNSAEHWLSLGGTLARYGAAASFTDWTARAADALERAIALDSTAAPAIELRLYVALWERDTVAIRHYAALMEPSVRAGLMDPTLLWAAGLVIGDTVAARRWRDWDGGDPVQRTFLLTRIPLHAVETGLPLDDGYWALEQLRAPGASLAEQNGAILGAAALAAASGRQVIPTADIWGGPEFMVAQVLLEPGRRGSVSGVTRRLLEGETGMPYPPPDGAGWPWMRACYGALARLHDGDTTGAAAAIRRLQVLAGEDPPPILPELWVRQDLRVCPLLLVTLLEHARGSAAAAERLDQLDALMRDGPQWLSWPYVYPYPPVAVANWTVARLREERGELDAALAAIRRRENSYYPPYLWTLPAFLRQEGRLAALVGDSAGALRAYDRYLMLRTDPDDPLRPQRDSVVAERAALIRGQ